MASRHSAGIYPAAEAAAHAVPSAAGAVEWTFTATGSGLVGLLIGAAAIPVIGFALAPAWALTKENPARADRKIANKPKS